MFWHIALGIESHITLIVFFMFSIFFQGNNISICLIIAQIISIAERSGELGGRLDTSLSLIFKSLSQVGINLPLNKYLIILRDNLDPCLHLVEKILRDIY